MATAGVTRRRLHNTIDSQGAPQKPSTLEYQPLAIVQARGQGNFPTIG